MVYIIAERLSARLMIVHSALALAMGRSGTPGTGYVCNASAHAQACRRSNCA